ncbi:hypothetical protein L249_5011 [Ophiocordyceps polyrhachis-furcata BCC 54312]|uniref:Uncharacterized protein n=1 Tax=Ophiocordyceps polyrhachis-furcata BCC 54312 TaxID=1330021 RepID=A0A367L3H4_9HYPO|nr:hypothetical protein L249_5011 [Ophiocordyceps polyrhachis-furcata BCC 54312]
MSLFTVLLFLLFLLLITYTNGDTFPEQIQKNLLKKLEDRAQINWDNPPYSEESHTPEPCRFFFRSVLSWKLRRQLKRNAGDKVQIENDAISQKRFLNDDRAPMTMRQEDSEWDIEGVSKSWHAGATYSLGKLDVSGGTAHSKFEQSMKISGRNLEKSCPGGHECHFQELVYYARWTGLCKTEVFNKRGADICLTPVAWKRRNRRPKAKTCSRILPYHLCSTRLRCSLRLPIRDANGLPLSTTLFVKESYITVPKAVSVDDRCVFKLDNGKWYDSDADIFWTRYDYYDDGRTQRWVLRDMDEPIPLIADSLLGNCTLPADDYMRKRDLDGARHRRVKRVVVDVVGGFGLGSAEE